MGMPRSLLPRPKPLMTVPDILMGNGNSGTGPPAILARVDAVEAAAALVVMVVERESRDGRKRMRKRSNQVRTLKTKGTSAE